MSKMGGGNSILNLYKYNDGYGIFGETPQFSEASVYFGDCSGRYGTTANHAVILVHKDIKQVTYRTPNRTDSIYDYIEYFTYNQFGIESFVMFTQNAPSGTLLVVSPSLEAVYNYKGPVYNFSNVEPIEIKYNETGFCLRKIGYYCSK